MSENSGNAYLEVKNLKTYFSTPGGLLHAVDDVSFSVNKGETLGIVGESGCGKSTLGRTILGLTPVTDGEVYFDGNKISNIKGISNKKKLKKEMQIIFQDPYSSLNPRMCVYELIADPIKTNGICKTKAEVREKVKELMDTVGLAERFMFAYPHELDGGRRQRIGVARALSLDPKLIICDEPVSALDVSIQAQILNLLQDIQEEKGLTYLFITHDLSVVKHISNEIMVMYLGTMVEKSSSKELFLHPLHPYTKGLLSAIPRPSIHQEKKAIIMQGELTSPIEPKPGCRFANRCPFVCDKCRQENPVLEEVLPGHIVACHNVKEINNL